MTDLDQKQLGKTLWGIADQLCGAMNADDYRDYMLSFLFLRYLSDNYEAASQKELGRDYPTPEVGDRRTPLAVWYAQNPDDTAELENRCAARRIMRSSHRTSGAASRRWLACKTRNCCTSCKRALIRSKTNPLPAPCRPVLRD